MKKTPLPLLDNPSLPGTMLVPLTRGQFAVVDATDARALGNRNWRYMKNKHAVTGYAVTTGLSSFDGHNDSVLLHRFLWLLWGEPETPEIDHRNGNGLDCRRLNLRAATRSQNVHNVGKRSTNTTGFKGVSRARHGVGFRARLINGRTERSLGVYATAEEAAAVVAAAALRERGEFFHG